MSATPIFSEQDHSTWSTLYKRQSLLRDQQLVPAFSQGLSLLGFNEKMIPDIHAVNSQLKSISGWQGVYTDGFVAAEDFFKMLSEKKFPIGNFIRNPQDLSYTPAPDVFHDLYGHIPFYTDLDYANFCQKFGESAIKFLNRPEALEAFQRLFWFTIEFALLKTPRGTRIFGAGIASSFSECEYALSSKPRIYPFNIKKIRHQNFRIDVMQEDIFLLNSVSELYNCISDFEKLLRSEIL